MSRWRRNAPTSSATCSRSRRAPSRTRSITAARKAEAVRARGDERAEAERRERERLEAENRRRVEEEDARRRAQEDAHRVAEQRSRDERGAAYPRARGARTATGERERPQALTPPPAAPAARTPEPAAVAAPPVPDDKQHTRYGRQELHVTEMSARATRRSAAPRRDRWQASAEGRHGFEMPTAPLVHESASVRPSRWRSWRRRWPSRPTRSSRR